MLRFGVRFHRFAHYEAIAKKLVCVKLRNPVDVDQRIRNKPSTESGACRPLFGDERNRWTAWSGIFAGGVTLDNLLEVWQATRGIIPGGSDVTGKVVHEKDQRTIAFEMGLCPQRGDF